MPMLEDFLLRFRRVWAPPGPVAGQAGVPEDAAVHREAELTELTAALEAIAAEGREIARAAESEALAIVEAARAESTRLLDAAGVEVPKVRAAAAAERVRDREAEIDRLLQSARDQAEGIRARGRSRMRPVVDNIVAAVYAGSRTEDAHAGVVGGG